jgi:hypothetical protein
MSRDVILTPTQYEDAQDGWHTVIVLGMADLDTLHAHLTLSYCDSSGKELWDKIKKQMAAKRFLSDVARDLEPTP